MNIVRLDFDENWKCLEEYVSINFDNDIKINNKDFMNKWSLVYNLCTQKSPFNYSSNIYNNCLELIIKILNEKKNLCDDDNVDKRTVIMSINKGYNNSYKLFSYLDKFHTPRNKLKSVKDSIFLLKLQTISYICKDNKELIEEFIE
tara:strand:- start:1359 stop:1796 length:438 start_codon:yes stop_codon:yes gene_type:complete